MLNIFLRSARQTICHTKKVQSVQKAFASFTVRDILQESSDEAGTLLSRFAKHIAVETRKNSPLRPTEIRYADYFPVSDLRYFRQELNRIAANQLPFLIVHSFTYRSNADPGKFAIVLNDLDAAALKHLPNMDVDTILHTLYAYIFLMPNWVNRLDFYHAAMQSLCSQFSDESPKEHFVQICFYLGLYKKQASAHGTKQLLQKFLEQHIERYLNDLSTMDLAVVCSAAYKTATQVKSAAYEQRMVEELLKLPLVDANDAILVTFIKSLRLQRVRSTDVCQYLGSLCSDAAALKQLQVSGLVHLFAYFAENLWDNKDNNAALINQFMQRLLEVHKFSPYAEGVRAKDLAMFLWCCAQLNCALNTKHLQVLHDVVIEKLHNYEFRFFVDQLVDCCLSLWSLNHQSFDLLQQAVQLKANARSRSNESRPKVDSRLKVLLSAVAIEQPKWLVNLKVTNTITPCNLSNSAPEYLLKNRADLKDYAHSLMEEEDIADVLINCPIDGINVPGLLVSLKSPANEQVCVELLTDEQILKFSKTPIGLIRLKTRLLSALDHKVLLLRAADIKENYTNFKALALDMDVLKDEQKHQGVNSI